MSARNSTHIVLHRPFVDDPGVEERWVGVKFCASLKAARAVVTSTDRSRRLPDRTAWGDLLLIAPVEGVNPLMLQHHVLKLYVVGRSGRREMVSTEVPLGTRTRDRIPNESWLSIWDGDHSHPITMLSLCERVHRRRLTFAACAGARVSLGSNGSHNRLVRFVDDIEAWACEPSTARMQAVVEIRNSLWSQNMTDEESMVFSLAGCARVPETEEPAGYAAGVADWACGFSSATRDEMADAVRRVIPLSVVLLSQIGETYPFVAARHCGRGPS